MRLQATLLKNDDSGATEPSTAREETSNPRGKTTEPELAVTITPAERPGSYRVRRFDLEGRVDDTVIALNVPTSESALAIADQEQITSQTILDHVRILDANSASSLGGSVVGRELRWVLLGLLIATLVAEQLLALRLSYHPEVAR